MIRKWDTTNKALEQHCIDQVITRIQEIDDTAHVGIIAAQEIVDLVLEAMAPEIFDKALNDASKILHEKLQEVDYRIDDLRQTPLG